MHTNEEKKIIIIDSFALIFRAYYAYPKTLTTPEHGSINAVYGFASFLIEILRKFEPEHIVVVADSEKPTIRSSEFVLYKANRKERDVELINQIPLVFDLVKAFDIPIYKTDGYEADDIIGTIANQARQKGFKSTIITGDQDLFQLIDGAFINVFLTGRNFAESKIYLPEDVVNKLGITPEQVPDYKGLAGDSSDNIPGVKGIGKKTAQELISQYKTIENIYENIDSIKGSTQKKLVENYEMAIKSKQLATIDIQVPIRFDLDLARTTVNKMAAINKLREFSFKSLESKLNALRLNLDVNQQMPLLAENNSLNNQAIDIKEYSGEKILTDSIVILIDDSNKENERMLYMCDDSDGPSLVMHKNISLFFDNLQTNLVISDDIKSLKKMRKVKGGNVVFHDIGYMVQMISGGEYMHNRNSLFNYFRIGNDSVETLLLNIFEQFDNILENITSNLELNNLYKKEIELIDIVIKMEESGIVLDLDILEGMRLSMEEKKQKIKNNIFKLAGKEFNVNSPRQVAEVLFTDKNIQPVSKTKKGAFSTSESALLKLKGENELVNWILEYREVDKILTTYLNTLPQNVRSDGRIHSSFDQMGAVSGRFSSKNPNLQNIPVEIPDINIRSGFIPSKGSVFVAFDYSQQELRILAHLAQEKTLIDAFNNGDDIHALTASRLFTKNISEITKEERSIGKTINFSIVYGISSFGLSERMQIPRAEANDLIKKFYETYPGIERFYEDSKQLMFQNLFTKTFFGRIRKSSNLKNLPFSQKNAVERELLNFIIQGSAADMVKLAMLRIDKLLIKNLSLLLQVHDELIFEYKTSLSLESLKQDKDFLVIVNQVRQEMENVAKLDVSLNVDAKIGYNWGSLQKI